MQWEGASYTIPLLGRAPAGRAPKILTGLVRSLY